MNKRPIQAFIFDCDGTLVNSEEPGIEVIQTLANRAGVVLSKEEALQRFTGLKMKDIVDWIELRLPRPIVNGFHESFTRSVREEQTRRFNEGLQSIRGAKELLDYIQLPVSVATNGPREKVELTLKLTGLRDYFSHHVYSAYEVGHFKPSPDLFLHVSQRLGVDAKNCAVVEDSLTGITAGLDAQMEVFALAQPHTIPKHLHEQVVFIEDLLALKQHLIEHRSSNT
jgi:HAD superfamily hydrolase (TIGR01509 family)